tara:strand:+ start:251 stop:517 length:267 start_codon:yes stop_codon:yes gene_type:complete
MFNNNSKSSVEGTTYVYLKRYVKTHPTAMLASDAHFEIIKIENGVCFEVDKNSKSNSKTVSVGDRVNINQAYEISLEANCIVEPVYPN